MKRRASLCLVLSAAAVSFGRPADPRQATVDYVHSLRAPGGGYRPTAKAAGASLRATTSSLRAIRYFGGTVQDSETTVAFVRSCFDRKAGGFGDAPGGKADVVLTAVGVMALVELKAAHDDLVKPAVAYLNDHATSFEEVRLAAAAFEALGTQSERRTAWLEQLAALQNADGTFGKGDGRARDTGGATAALLRLGGRVKDAAATRRAMDADQRDDGGFGPAGKPSDLDTTYRVMRAYHMLGILPPRPEGVRLFVARCRAADGGYGVSPGAPPGSSGTYYASVVLHWLGAK